MRRRSAYILINEQLQYRFCARLRFLGKNSVCQTRTKDAVVIVGDREFYRFPVTIFRRRYYSILCCSAKILLRTSAQLHDVNASHQHHHKQKHERDLYVARNHCVAPLLILRIAMASASAPARRSAEILKPFLLAGTSTAIAGAAIECNGSRNVGWIKALNSRFPIATAAVEARISLSFWNAP